MWSVPWWLPSFLLTPCSSAIPSVELQVQFSVSHLPSGWWGRIWGGKAGEGKEKGEGRMENSEPNKLLFSLLFTLHQKSDYLTFALSALVFLTQDLCTSIKNSLPLRNLRTPLWNTHSFIYIITNEVPLVSPAQWIEFHLPIIVLVGETKILRFRLSSESTVSAQSGCSVVTTNMRSGVHLDHWLT